LHQVSIISKINEQKLNHYICPTFDKAS